MRGRRRADNMARISPIGLKRATARPQGLGLDAGCARCDL